DDIIDALSTGLSPGAAPSESCKPLAAPSPPPPELEGLARQVWEFLADGPRHVDAMTQQLGLPVPEVTRTLMMLEMKKVVRRLPAAVQSARARHSRSLGANLWAGPLRRVGRDWLAGSSACVAAPRFPPIASRGEVGTGSRKGVPAGRPVVTRARRHPRSATN